MLRNFIEKMGVLRSLLAVLSVVLICMMPLADITVSPEGWGLVRSAVLPAAVPMVFMLLMLDLMMCQVLKSDADAARKSQLNFISKVHLVLAAILVLSWLPVFLRATYL